MEGAATAAALSLDELAVRKGQRFKDRKSCRSFLQDFVLAQGKRVVVDKKASGGKNIVFRCSSRTCSFEVRVLKSAAKDVRGFFIGSYVLEHHGCTGHARPTQRQISELEVARAAVTANPKTPAKSLQNQVQHSASLTVAERMMYRVQEQIMNDNLGNYEEEFKKIDSLLKEFARVNSESRVSCERDSEGRFWRAFLSNPLIAGHEQHGQKVLGVDGSFMRHGVYKETMLILVGRTGKNTNIILAVALCDGENEENCGWFLSLARSAGVSFEGIPVFSDRGRGLIAALNNSQLGRKIRFCTRHIVGNTINHFDGHVPVDLKTMVYLVQGAETEEEYKSHLFSLGLTHPRIAEYVQAIDRAMGDAPGTCARSQDDYMEKFMEASFKAQELGSTWQSQGRVVTPFAQGKIDEQQTLSGRYTVKRKTLAAVWKGSKCSDLSIWTRERAHARTFGKWASLVAI